MAILSLVPSIGGVRLACQRSTFLVPVRSKILCRSLRVRVRGIRACAVSPAAPCQRGFELGFGAFQTTSLQTTSVRDGLLVFQQARSPELIRAAAYLRAVSFYPFPEGRSEEAIQLHRKMKVADEFSSLKSKVGGLQQGYKRIVCILALYPLSRLANSTVVKLHPSLKVTLENGEEYVVVGSLDLNQGIALPGEVAVKKISQMSTSFRLARTSSSSITIAAPSRSTQSVGGNLRERGYLSNVCVAPLMRQRGIGTALLQQAQSIAQNWGIKNLYVHAVSTNEAAVKLYNKADFTVEKEELASTISSREEAPEFAAFRRRQIQPRRLLLHKSI